MESFLHGVEVVEIDSTYRLEEAGQNNSNNQFAYWFLKKYVDDVPSAAWPAYGLTTIKQDAEAMVTTTVNALLSEIGGTEVTPPAPLPVTLVRRTTA